MWTTHPEAAALLAVCVADNAHLLAVPAYRAAYRAARPYAEEAVRRMVAERKVRPDDFEHQCRIWQNYAAFDAVSRRKTIEEIAAVQVPGFSVKQERKVA